MAEQQDQSEKTEQATAKRLADASRKGDFGKSQDVATWFVLLGCMVIFLVASPVFSNLSQSLAFFIYGAHDIALDPAGARSLLNSTLAALLGPMAAVFALLTLFALAGHLIQHMPAWTAAKMMPKLDKISPLKGLTRLFGPQGWMNLLRAILKLIAIAAAIGYALWPVRTEIDALGLIPLTDMVSTVHGSALRMMMAALVAVGMIAALDYGWQRSSFQKRMRMSRRDIRDETRQSEGDPMVRARLRAIRQERGRQRMMAAVADATVVIANPTHYAVALAYDLETSEAPVCVAKGVDQTALRIRQIAKEAGVPVVENPPLARTLHAGVELDRPIPVDSYEAVAKIIGYVMQTSKAGGQ